MNNKEILDATIDNYRRKINLNEAYNKSIKYQLKKYLLQEVSNFGDKGYTSLDSNVVKEILYSDPDNTPYSSNMDINIICNTLGLSSNKTDDRFYNTIHLKGNINLGLFVLDFMDGYKLFAYFVTSYKDINDSIVGEITLKESFK